MKSIRTLSSESLSGTNITTPERPIIQPIKPRPWIAEASCRYVEQGEADALFFPWSHRESGPAIDICNKCPVKRECAAYALETEVTHGVFGGVFMPGHHDKSAAKDALHKIAYGEDSTRQKKTASQDARKRNQEVIRDMWLKGADIDTIHEDTAIRYETVQKVVRTEQRREQVARLRDAGWSIPRISLMLSSNYATIKNDCQAVGAGGYAHD